MHDFGDRRGSAAGSDSSHNRKRLGGYLVEAGLLTPAQVDVVLNDQKLTGMRFGEILAARGWVKQQTIEYLMKKIVLPEQSAPSSAQAPTVQTATTQSGGVRGISARPDVATELSGVAEIHRQNSTRKDIPISKPLPSVNQADGDVSWVG